MKYFYRFYIALGLFGAFLAFGCAWAGDFNELNGMAIKGYDPVAYFVEQKAVKGDDAFRADYRGSSFRFTSAANRDTFLAAPEKYAPQYGGYCAYGVSHGGKADVDPNAFSIVDGKLYLNYNADVKSKWLKDVPGNISKAEGNWPEVAKIGKVVRQD